MSARAGNDKNKDPSLIEPIVATWDLAPSKVVCTVCHHVAPLMNDVLSWARARQEGQSLGIIFLNPIA